MRFVVLHYHIFKNAGSTVEEILDRSFGDGFSRFDPGNREELVSHQDLFAALERNPRLKAISSHQIRYPVPAAPGFLFFDICILRDPVDRIRSMYDYFRERPAAGDPMSDLAQTTTLGDFIAGLVDRFQLYIKNVQVNLIACAGDSDEPEEKDLKLALRRMSNTSFLGVVDRFDESLRMGQEWLSPAFPELDCAQTPVNVTGGLGGTLAARINRVKDACDPGVYAELLRLNALDCELVERAREEIGRRLRMGAREPRAVRATGMAPPAQPGRPALRTRVKRALQAVRYAGVWLRPSNRRLFDSNYYQGSLWDFLLRGGYDGRTPHPLFDPDFYLRRYPDVAAAQVNPLAHYLSRGARERRQPHPLFDPNYYLERNADVRGAGLNPLLHYVCHGAAEGRKPHPLFQPDYYLAGSPEAKQHGANPLIHFLAARGQVRPHPLFDGESYSLANPGAAPEDGNPLVDYLLAEHAGSSGHSHATAGETFRVAELDLFDVPLALICLNQDPNLESQNERECLRGAFADCAERAGIPGHVVLAWRHRSGRSDFAAEPQQRAFFRAVAYDQVSAQVNQTLICR